MFPYIDSQGRLWIPVIPRPEADGGLIGDAFVELLPNDPEYQNTLAWVLKERARMPVQTF
jgi:hypothetical protein